jgi:LAO/AO transport system kinase
MKSLAEGVLAGEQLATARLIRDLDDHMPGAIEHLRQLYPHTGHAQIIGITGNPGCGKSTLVDGMIQHFRRERGLRVGVVAVDPSSPFTGGAILGDRIRMQRHALDQDVFIRSMASRGHLGGLSRSTSDVAVVLDAMGCDVILIETVGVGQAEVDIVEAAHVSVVVVVPGLGDEVQAIKAGVLEIADLFCVNKADREGADRATQDLEMMLTLRPAQLPQPPIMSTVASTGRGIAELAETLMGLLDLHDLEAWEARRVRRAKRQIEDLLRERVTQITLDGLGARFDELVHQVAERERDPYSVVDEIVAAL